MSSTPDLLIQKLFSDAIVPKRAHPTDSGLDLSIYKFLKYYPKGGNILESGLEDTHSFLLSHGDRILIHTGIAATVGEGYEIQIRPKSGLALKNGLTVLNTPGTIDEAYRGMLGVIIINFSGVSQTLSKGMQIAQMVVCPVVLCPVVPVADLNDTERGLGGFGSTGI
jgi:dUTP pyrophosphatase